MGETTKFEVAIAYGPDETCEGGNSSFTQFADVLFERADDLDRLLEIIGQPLPVKAIRYKPPSITATTSPMLDTTIRTSVAMVQSSPLEPAHASAISIVPIATR